MSDWHRANTLLGYPRDARLLIINADDFGMYHAINEGVLHAMTQGVVTSTSLMMPLPGASEAVKHLQQNPDLSFGVHLSILRDIPDYHWKPIAPPERVPSLLAETGEFYTSDETERMLERAKIVEIEIEFRAQIEAVLAAGVKPAHVDWHCLHNGGRPDMLDLTLSLAKEYRLALRVYDPPLVEKLQAQGLPADEHPLLDSFTMDIPTKREHYTGLLRELPTGLNEWAVHPSTGEADSRGVDPGGWQVRQSDYQFLISPEARDLIQNEGIILLSYRDLQHIWYP